MAVATLRRACAIKVQPSWVSSIVANWSYWFCGRSFEIDGFSRHTGSGGGGSCRVEAPACMRHITWTNQWSRARVARYRLAWEAFENGTRGCPVSCLTHGAFIIEKDRILGWCFRTQSCLSVSIKCHLRNYTLYHASLLLSKVASSTFFVLPRFNVLLHFVKYT